MTTLRRATMAALTTAVFAGSLALRGADSTAPELAAALQKKYNGIKDFSADFSHTYEGGVLHKQITERGQLLVKKPAKMRWD
jgi:outer membrane lipoprotein-sorting protein